MIPLISFVQTTAYEATPPSLRLPRFAWHLFSMINKVHGAWRWYRKVELYTTPDRFFELLAGHVLHFVVGDLFIVRIAAQSLLIATRILECSQQQAAFCRTGKKWLRAFSSPEYQYAHSPLIKGKKWISPSSFCWWRQIGADFAARVQAIVHFSFKLFERGFRLSMSLLDALDAICLNPHTAQDAMQESVVNIMKWIDAIVENRQELLKRVGENRQIIERLLEKSSLTYEQFYAALVKTIQGTRAVQQTVKFISVSARRRILEAGKIASTSSLVIMGVH